MAEKEVKLMKGNEVIAHAAIRYGLVWQSASPRKSVYIIKLQP